MHVFGVNPTRAAALRYLAQAEEPCTSGDVARSIGITYQTISGILRELEDDGIVTSDAGSDRKGQRIRYELAPGSVEQSLADLRAYLTGR